VTYIQHIHTHTHTHTHTHVTSGQLQACHHGGHGEVLLNQVTLEQLFL